MRPTQIQERVKLFLRKLQAIGVILMPNVNKIEVEPIGFVKRTSRDEDVKDRRLISRVVLKNELADGLDGVEEFSHVFIIFWLHKISDYEKTVLKVHPKGRVELPPVGIFATRAPNRPNTIGLTLVELVKREENSLFVKGLDAFDGTPILDIKPYDSWDAAASFDVPK